MENANCGRTSKEKHTPEIVKFYDLEKDINKETASCKFV